MDVDTIVASMATVCPHKQRVGLDTVRTLLSNVVESPGQEKYRTIKKTNAGIRSKLFPECFDLLRAAGFEDHGEKLILREPGPDLVDVCNIVEALLMSQSTQPSASSSQAPVAKKPGTTSTPNPVSRRVQQLRQREEQSKEERRRGAATAQEQLAALREQRAGRYQQQQDMAFAHHLSRHEDGSDYDTITAMNQSLGAVHSFVTCTTCHASLRYKSNTRAQAVLCPCGSLLHPAVLQDQTFIPRSPSDLPVEPGEPVDGDQSRTRGGPEITVRGPDGARMRLPLHSVLQMVRQHEQRQQTGANDESIEALPTRRFQGTADAAEETNCQICMEDFAEGDELRTLPCFHLYHAACVDQWLKVNSICPNCRHEIS